MDRTAQGTLDGRAVELREVSAGIGMKANQAGDGREGMLFVLIHSAHWADTGERVFKERASVDDDWKMRHLPEIMALVATSAELNLNMKVGGETDANGAAAVPLH